MVGFHQVLQFHAGTGLLGPISCTRIQLGQMFQISYIFAVCRAKKKSFFGFLSRKSVKNMKILKQLVIFFFYANHPLQGFKSHCSVRGYKLLLQQKLIDPPLECCEIVICWKAFIGEGVPNGCGSRKKA